MCQDVCLALILFNMTHFVFPDSSGLYEQHHIRGWEVWALWDGGWWGRGSKYDFTFICHVVEVVTLGGAGSVSMTSPSVVMWWVLSPFHAWCLVSDVTLSCLLAIFATKSFCLNSFKLLCSCPHKADKEPFENWYKIRLLQYCIHTNVGFEKNRKWDILF